jgi:hypothetical protein
MGNIGQPAMHTWFKIINYLATLLTLLVWCARAKNFMRAALLLKRRDWESWARNY